MRMADRIERKLCHALQASRVTVHDDSRKHRGHSGAAPGGETHFRVEVVAQQFAGLKAVERHRLVYDALAAELGERVHALQVSARTPDEAAARTP